MARYNEIQVGRFGRAVQKIFGVKGEVPVGSLAGELILGHNFDNGVENRYLEGWDRFGAVIAAPAPGAGNRAAVRFRNPTGSNVIVVVEKLAIGEVLSDQPIVEIAAQTAELPSGAQSTGAARIDKRGRPNPTLIISQTTGVAGATPSGNQQIQVAQPANSTIDIIFTDHQEFPILPGDAVTIYSGTLNQAINSGTIIWRERFLEESEKS